MSYTSTPAVAEPIADAAEQAAAQSRPSTQRPLTTADRCDVCGAQAFIRVVLSAGELLFCGHHGRAHRDALDRQALFVQDETGRLAPGA